MYKRQVSDSSNQTIRGNVDVVGILTASTFSITDLDVGDNLTVGTGATIGTGVTIYGNSGIVSATSFFGTFSGNSTGLTGTPSIAVADITGIGANLTGVVTASSFSGTLNSSNLTGALPALNGSALTNLNIPAGFNELDAALFN